jgi:hypothetical protein
MYILLNIVNSKRRQFRLIKGPEKIQFLSNTADIPARATYEKGGSAILLCAPKGLPVRMSLQ